MANYTKMTFFTPRLPRRTERLAMSVTSKFIMSIIAMTTIVLVASSSVKPASSFVITNTGLSDTTVRSPVDMTTGSSPSSSLRMSFYSSPSKRRGSRNDDKSKRQHRVGQLVQTELARILHTGLIKSSGSSSSASKIPASLRQRISIVGVDISPDLRQARVSVSIRSSGSADTRHDITATRVIDDDGDDDEEGVEQDQFINSRNDDVVDKRRAYSWLVDNTKSIRHTLAQRLSHMKSSAPNLQFALVDVAAAVDVMYLIDKVSKGYQREDLETEYIYDSDDDDDDEYYYDDEDDDEWDETFFSE